MLVNTMNVSSSPLTPLGEDPPPGSRVAAMEGTAFTSVASFKILVDDLINIERSVTPATCRRQQQLKAPFRQC